MEKEKITLLAVGDVNINRPDPKSIFDRAVEVLNSGDITFANCDQTYSDNGRATLQQSTYSNQRNIPALIYAGLDVISLANNHTLDWGYDALSDTLVRLREAGIQIAGAGNNIAEARKPVLLEKKGKRVGFLAYCCTGPEDYTAGENHPGYAPVRIWTHYHRADPQPGMPPEIITLARKDDLAAMVEDIRKLKAVADVVAVSFHWGLHFLPEVIPQYGFEVGHAAIDAGADVILGGHPHILKGIEVYRGKVIFHSLGNFANGGPKPFTQSYRPKDHDHHHWAKKYGFTPDTEIGTEYVGWLPDARKTVIAKVVIEGGQISRVSYLPCYVNKDCQAEVMPRRDPRAQEVFDYLEKISRNQDLPVRFAWDGDEVVISR